MKISSINKFLDYAGLIAVALIVASGLYVGLKMLIYASNDNRPFVITKTKEKIVEKEVPKEVIKEVLGECPLDIAIKQFNKINEVRSIYTYPWRNEKIKYTLEFWVGGYKNGTGTRLKKEFDSITKLTQFLEENKNNTNYSISDFNSINTN